MQLRLAIEDQGAENVLSQRAEGELYIQYAARRWRARAADVGDVVAAAAEDEADAAADAADAADADDDDAAAAWGKLGRGGGHALGRGCPGAGASGASAFERFRTLSNSYVAAPTSECALANSG